MVPVTWIHGATIQTGRGLAVGSRVRMGGREDRVKAEKSETWSATGTFEGVDDQVQLEALNHS